MLGKLFKHEWIAISRLLVVIHGFILIFAVLSRILFEVGGGLNVVMADGADNILAVIALLMIFAIVLFIFCAAMFTSVYIAYRFYKNVFTDQGYLTNTLPVTPTQIIVSKGLTALLWTIIDLAVLAAALLIMFADGEFMSALMPTLVRLISYLAPMPPFGWIILVMVLLSPFLMIIHMYFCVAVGSLVPNHKILGAIGVYIVSYIIVQIISTVILVVTGFGFSVGSMDSSTANMTGAQASQYIMGILTPMFLVSVICEIIAIVAFFLVTKYIMTKKLNLE